MPGDKGVSFVRTDITTCAGRQALQVREREREREREPASSSNRPCWAKIRVSAHQLGGENLELAGESWVM